MSINEQTFGDPYASTGQDTARPTPVRGGQDAAQDAAQDAGLDSSQAAARLLEMTARETDQWRAEAKGEAATIVAGAKDEAAGLVRAAREEAERLLATARQDAEKTVNDARVEAYRVREETTAVRKRHDEDVAHLQRVATQHRERLRQHLTSMLEQVESVGAGDDQ
jgi:cell division septum initiation protein DivIVA